MLLFCSGFGFYEHAVEPMGTMPTPRMGHRPDNRQHPGALYEHQDSTRIGKELRQHIAETEEKLARRITQGQKDIVDGLCVHEAYFSAKF